MISDILQVVLGDIALQSAYSTVAFVFFMASDTISATFVACDGTRMDKMMSASLTKV